MAERLGVPDALGLLLDHRRASHVTHPLVELVLTRVLLLAQGWQDQDDADALRDHPALRRAVSTRHGPAPMEASVDARTPDGLASQPTLSRMQSMLGSELNRRRAHDIVAERACARILAAEGRRAEVTFDIDSYADTGDMLGARLRPGNVHTADDVRSRITALLPRVRALGKKVWLRMDCGYANEKFLAGIAERSGARTRARRSLAGPCSGGGCVDRRRSKTWWVPVAVASRLQ